MVLNEVRRLEEAALRNDEELRQMSLEQQQQSIPIQDSDDIEIRNEISQLKLRLSGTDQELQRTNHTLRLETFGKKTFQHVEINYLSDLKTAW